MEILDEDVEYLRKWTAKYGKVVERLIMSKAYPDKQFCQFELNVVAKKITDRLNQIFQELPKGDNNDEP